MLSLARIDSELKAYEAMYAAAFYEFQQKELRMLRQKIVEGLNLRELLSANAASFWRYRAQLRAHLLDVMTRIRIFGQRQVEDELERQKT